jgi:hypothetical protein
LTASKTAEPLDAVGLTDPPLVSFPEDLSLGKPDAVGVDRGVGEFVEAS